MKKIYCLVSCALCFWLGYGQVSLSFDFKLQENYIIIEANTEFDTLNLIFDTGSNLSLLDTQIANKMNLIPENKMQLSVISGLITGYTTDFELYNCKNWTIVNLGSIIKKMNYPIHGLLAASDLLVNNCVEIDFLARKIYVGKLDSTRLHPLSYEVNPLVALNKKTDKGFSKYLPPSPSVNWNVQINNEVREIDLMIDTGCGYEVALISNDSAVIQDITSYKDFYNTINDTKRQNSYCKISLPKEPNVIYENTPIFYCHYCSSNISGLLGTAFLKRYHKVILDWPTKRAFFVPYQ
ncbi:MAG: hypothetical protein JEZ14_19920 [Marinilabiliaceae bacterium]|nr:hypothetical protein [Marinilabiliaceae bacterium]